MAKCSKCGSPACMCGSPAHTVGEVVDMQEQLTFKPPVPMNERGGSKPVFSPYNDAVGQNIFGTPEQRQKTMPNPPLYKLDPMYNGKPGVQKEDFEQFKK